MSEDRELSFNERNILEFRERGGKIASFGDAPVLLLTTTGAKSGKRRISPVMYLLDETGSKRNRVYVFASAAGADKNPAWFHNLVAHPDDVEVEIGTSTYTAHASVLAETEREQTYAIQASRYPGFAEYQRKTTRKIPVIALTLDNPLPA